MTVTEQLVISIAPIVALLISLASYRMAKLITDKFGDHDYLRGVLLRLNEAAFDIVSELEESTVSHLREMSADGKLDSDDVAELRAEALGALKAHLGAKGIGELERILDRDAVERLLRAHLESAVSEMKDFEPEMDE